MREVWVIKVTSDSDLSEGGLMGIIHYINKPKQMLATLENIDIFE